MNLVRNDAQRCFTVNAPIQWNDVDQWNSYGV